MKRRKPDTLIDAQGKPVEVKRKSFDLIRTFKYVKYDWWLIAIAFAAAIANAIISAQIPNDTGKLFDETNPFDYAVLWNVIWQVLLTFALTTIVNVISLFAESRATLSARKSVWKIMMNVKMSYYDTHDPASLLNTVTMDAELVGASLPKILIQLPAMFVLIVFSLIIVSGYSGQLLLMICIIIGIHIVSMAVLGIFQKKLATQTQIQGGFFTGFLAERIRNFSMIKSYGTTQKEYLEGVKNSREIRKIGMKGVILTGFNSLYSAAIFLMGTVIALVWGGALYKAGTIDLPAYISSVTYIGTINALFIMISIYWVLIKDFNGRAYRVARLCEAPQEDAKKGGITEIGDGDLKFGNVDFNYTNGEKVIKDVSFTVPQGKITALVGPSGSGKTTVVKLLEQLYSPTAGTICLGEQNIADYDIQAWRRKLAYVVQDAGIFSGSLRECLTYGVEREVSDEELDEVTKLTGLYDFIQFLPDKYETPILSWGSSLSGGQRQRIVISRALLRKADILIFDEPTSALDPESANAISKLIFESFAGKTVIIISHELNYIAKADNIVFLHNGVIEGEGDHATLMNNCKTYHDLVEEQSYQEVFGK